MHSPQSMMLPQPLPVRPHATPWVPQLFGVQLGVWHLLSMHCAGSVQVPQGRVPPQPSAISPQVAMMSVHLRGVHDGGGGGCCSSQTREERSKNMNSSASSCGDRE